MITLNLIFIFSAWVLTILSLKKPQEVWNGFLFWFGQAIFTFIQTANLSNALVYSPGFGFIQRNGLGAFLLYGCIGFMQLCVLLYHLKIQKPSGMRKTFCLSGMVIMLTIPAAELVCFPTYVFTNG